MLDRALDLLIANMEEVMARDLPADVMLSQAMVMYFTTILENRDLSAVLLLEHRSLEPELHLRHVPRRDRFENLWRQLIQQGKDEGMFNCADPAMAARALLGSMNWAITWFRTDRSHTPEMIADEFADLFLNGLMKR